MKRTLVTAALGTALASVAQAQTTSVTLYGIADADFRLDHTTIGTLKSVGSGGESGSRWGSKRTDVYTGAGKQSNRGNALFVLNDATNAGLYTTVGTTPGSPGNVTPGFDPWSAQIGIRHRF